MSQATVKSVRVAIFSLVLIVGFQNCTPSHFSSTDKEQNKTSGSNGGFDGKTYAEFVHVGGCSSDPALADTRVDVSTDLSTVNIVRANCQDLTAPYTNAVADFDLSGMSHNIIYDKQTNEIFDLEVTTNTQKSTKLTCEAAAGGAYPFVDVSEDPITKAYSGELVTDANSTTNFDVTITSTSTGYTVAGTPTLVGSQAYFDLYFTQNAQTTLRYFVSALTGTANVNVNCYADATFIPPAYVTPPAATTSPVGTPVSNGGGSAFVPGTAYKSGSPGYGTPGGSSSDGGKGS